MAGFRQSVRPDELIGTFIHHRFHFSVELWFAHAQQFTEGVDIESRIADVIFDDFF